VVGHTGIKNIRPENGKSSVLTGPIQRSNGYMKQKGREENVCRRPFYINYVQILITNISIININIHTHTHTHTHKTAEPHVRCACSHPSSLAPKLTL
jgi:hypothetical protein